MTETEVVVVGAGIMGVATAWALARSGHEVVVLERFEPGHTHGSSHGTSRIFRHSYPDPLYVGMTIEARSLWRELEEETGRTLLEPTGALDLGGGLDDHKAALSAHRLGSEILSAADVSKRWPFVYLDEGETALFQSDASMIRADEAISAFTGRAEVKGAAFSYSSPVTRIHQTDNGVVVSTESGEEIHALTAVVTAGPWAKGLLAEVGIELVVRPTRETIAYFSFDSADGNVVPALVEWGEPTVYSLAAPGEGIKAGEHIAGPTADPDAPSAPDEESVQRVSEWIRRRFGRELPLLRAETCFYTNTEDESFVLERHGNIVVGSACSGHAFKFAPLVGTRLERLATS
ncbi:MAG TPA: N-methyl-L-tryptophan oxidase [Actinomycetota bacterium]|nr:N-methyl-L-tryptophan oxidase [Actinomycetota bacterium]